MQRTIEEDNLRLAYFHSYDTDTNVSIYEK